MVSAFRCRKVFRSVVGRRYYISDSAFNGSSYTTIPYRIFTESEVNFSRQSIYSSGTTIATEIVPGRENSGSRIHIFTPAIPTLLSRTYDNGVRITSAPLEEYYTVEECVHEVVQAVVEVRAGNPANVPRYQRNGNIALNPVVLETTRVFLVLTMAGIRRFVQHRPLDLLQSTLIANRDGYRVVRDSFGTCQIAAMGLELAITEDLAVKPTAASIVQVVLANAPEPETKGDPQNLLIKFSPRHDGLALTIARLLRPLWYNTVIARMPNGLFDLNIGERQLEQTQQSLSRLRQFLENEGRSLFVGHIVEGAHRKPAWVQEEMSINGLTRLVTQAIEAIAFVLLLKANKIHEVVAR
jgi:nuclear pore complex protein Nup155